LKLEEDLATLALNSLPQIPENNVLSSASPDIAITNAFGFSGGGSTIGVIKFVA
jgi:hypothetical protein